jgi:hypothetical protein
MVSSMPLALSLATRAHGGRWETGLVCHHVDTAARPVTYTNGGSGREAEPIGTDVGGVLQ